jgi:prolyl-tRNA synthetase
VLGEKRASGIRYLLDPRVVPGTAWITGADAPGRHVFDLVAGRDFDGDGTVEAAQVKDGDACPSCGGTLSQARGIEVGHIFQLGRKYADALGLQVLDENGKLVTVTGLVRDQGVRAVAASSRPPTTSWPVLAARGGPADVHLIATGKDAEVFTTADRLPPSSRRAASACSTTTGRRCRPE